MLLSQNLRKGEDFVTSGYENEALEAFWRGLEEPGRSSGGVLEEVLGILGNLGKVIGLPMPICKKNVQFLTPSWAPCWAKKKCVFFYVENWKNWVPRGVAKKI